ncbi:uncharacterized protein TRIREDRAFT_121471 [Trichoderma reesei QM6a]|uniref:Predicted protein n=1 Tax=Hypocrea jecorina (strain QM6a) TaxID=431241 RepID=G0RGX9_HYPJQ|nr:uncharacterized protein TRIREDRAFT_121471 [Trichoderma reesei QM6a]EGR49647.1 predicted protein [Trichoderma reesei QM6a]
MLSAAWTPPLPPPLLLRLPLLRLPPPLFSTGVPRRRLRNQQLPSRALCLRRQNRSLPIWSRLCPSTRASISTTCPKSCYRATLSSSEPPGDASQFEKLNGGSATRSTGFYTKRRVMGCGCHCAPCSARITHLRWATPNEPSRWTCR